MSEYGKWKTSTGAPPRREINDGEFSMAYGRSDRDIRHRRSTTPNFLLGSSRLPWPGVLGFLRRAFSASFLLQTGCSRFLVPGVLGFPDRVFSVSCGRSRPPTPVPGVFGYPDRVFSVSCTGHSRPPVPVPGVLGYPNRVFSVSCAGRSRFPSATMGFFGTGERVTPRHISPGL